MSSADCVKDGGKQGGTAGATSQTVLFTEALLGCVDAAATGCLGKIGLELALLLAFVDDALYPTEGVIARPADLTADVDADGAVADGANVKLGPLDVGLELLGEEIAELLEGEPLDVEGSEAGQVNGAVGPDRQGAAQFGNVQQIDLEAVPGTQNVVVVCNDGLTWERGRMNCRGRQSSQG